MISTDFDARNLLAEGQDPFEEIQKAWQALPPGQRLRVIAPFEPQPLAGYFSSQGVAVRPERGPDGEHWLWVGPKVC